MTEVRKHSHFFKNPLIRAGVNVVFVLGLGFGVVWLSNILTEKTGIETPQPTLIHRPTCANTLAEYQSLVKLGQDVVIARNLKSRAEANHFIPDPKKITVYRTGSPAEVACGYLHIVAKVDNRPLNSYESIYIAPNEFGGHLDTTNVIPMGKDADESQYLLDLTAIAYRAGAKLTYSQGNNIPYNKALPSQAPHVADWAMLFNVSASVDFRIALSTSSTHGIIKEVDIAYVCWNPNTGKFSSACKLTTQQ